MQIAVLYLQSEHVNKRQRYALVAILGRGNHKQSVKYYISYIIIHQGKIKKIHRITHDVKEMYRSTRLTTIRPRKVIEMHRNIFNMQNMFLLQIENGTSKNMCQKPQKKNSTTENM